jgi:hypothetical protein
MEFASNLISKSSNLDVCQSSVESLFPRSKVQFLAAQGGCSATFLLLDLDDDTGSYTEDRIVQFREAKFGLNLDISAAAVQVYKKYAPVTRQINPSGASVDVEGMSLILCYEMDIIPGIPYSSTIPYQLHLTASELERHTELVESFADFVARAWPTPGSARRTCNGKVGSQIPHKLWLLAAQLPTATLRATAKQALDDISLLNQLPVVLNHGDVVPGNIMVETETFKLKGMVDWAEAEYLPFGTCLYGIEYLFGCIPVKERRDSLVEGRRFQYYSSAEDLRRTFWQRLRFNISALDGDKDLQEAVLLSKLVGTLLWYGFAWDDGAIDRVVDAAKDGEEVAFLESFARQDRDRAALQS